MNSTTELNMIAELDLDSIKAKLMHKQSGEGWSAAHANAVECEYRRFLCLMKLFPHEQVTLRFDVDIFWHYHILDTMKYAADCEQIFGYFLHHVPSSAQQGEDDEALHRRNAARMQKLHEKTFGEACIGQREQGKAATAGSAPTPAKMAWCTPMIAKSAWCTPMTPKKTCYTPMTGKPAWCTPATAFTPRQLIVAPNDQRYARQLMTEAA
jgi:hypothetical protein